MADGIRCKRCGWQETEHDFTDTQIEADREQFEKPRRGKKISLIKCRGYTPEYPKLAQRLTELAKKESEERAMRGLDPLGE